MPRTARGSVGGVCYHVMNRSNGKARVFHEPQDYAAFVRLVGEAGRSVPMRVVAYCLMPNHFHFVLWPRGNRDMSRWMHWLLTSHVQRYRRHHGTTGRVWQGRFKAFPIQHDEHLLTVMRYVERNALRAGLVARAEHWPWSSLHRRYVKQRSGFLRDGPVSRFLDWVGFVNEALTVGELEAVRACVNRGRPYGDESWTQLTAERLGLQSSLRPRGRPPRG